MGKKLLGVVILLILVATTLAYHDSAQATTWYTYDTSWTQPSYWWGGKVRTYVRYGDNTTNSVKIRYVYAEYDNRNGTAITSSSLGRVYDGYGAWAFNDCNPVMVDPGTQGHDYFSMGQTYYKNGNQVQVLNGAATSGNCEFGFTGWRVYFYVTGGIGKVFTE